MTTIADYTRISSNMSKSLSATAQEPDVSRETAYYLANIGNVKSIDDFVNNYRLFSYAMQAYGLSDMTYAKAFMKKVLTEGISSTNSFANKLSDPRFRQFAAAFDFADLGSYATQATAATTGTTQQYVQQTLEQDAGNQNEGVQLALYFTRKASSITGPFQVLADKALTQVVQTALGLPPTVSSGDIDAQAAMLSKMITFSDWQDPAKVTQFAERFAAMWDATQTSNDISNGTSDNPALMLIGGSTGSGTSDNPALILVGQAAATGLDSDLLAKLQSIKLGR
jgi:hypothetical protein